LVATLDRRPLKNNTGIIHALDIEKLTRAVEIAREVEPFVDAIKLPWQLIMVNGAAAISQVKKEILLPVITDFKVADIPEISSSIVRNAVHYGADGITLQGFVGKDTLEACIRVAHESSALTFVVTEMSHPGAERFMLPVGTEIARMAKELGSDGIVAPATRPERMKEYRKIAGEDMLIMSPGVGAQGANVGDAIRAGANFEVIGRRIYQSEDPRETAKRFAEMIAEARASL